jgi:hypothetical protein
MYKYGFFEFKAKFAEASLLQSIWLQSKTTEIDVADFIKSATHGNSLTNNYHCFGENANGVADKKSGMAFEHFDKNPNFDPTKLVTYGLDWYETGIDIYINGDKISSHSTRCLTEDMYIVFTIDVVALELPSWSKEYTMHVTYFRHWTKADAVTNPTRAPTEEPTEKPTNGPAEILCHTLLTNSRSAVSYDPSFAAADVCSTSKPNGKCIQSSTLAAAEDTCVDLGGRLCTANELAEEVAKASSKACGLDQRLVWTLTPCIIEGTEIRGTTSRQGGGSSKDDRCIASAKSKVGVICCAGKSSETSRSAVLASRANDTLILPAEEAPAKARISDGAIAASVFGGLVALAIIAWIVATQKKKADDKSSEPRAATYQASRSSIDSTRNQPSVPDFQEPPNSIEGMASTVNVDTGNEFVFGRDGSIRASSEVHGNPLFRDSVLSGVVAI